MNELVNDEAVYRTALATPGLLIFFFVLLLSFSSNLLQANESFYPIADTSVQYSSVSQR